MHSITHLRICGEKIFMGKGVRELLDAIDEHKSIKKASEVTGISYPKAMRMLKAFEVELGFPAVISAKGGNTYGGSQLSAKGRLVLECYREIQKEVEEYADRLVQERFKF